MNNFHFAQVGDTAVLIAAKAGHHKCLQLLLEADADVDKVNRSGTNLLFHCMTDPDALADVLESGADPDVRLADNRTVLSILCGRDFPESIRLLLEANAECDRPVGSEDPKRPLEIAIEYGKMDQVKLLFTYTLCMGNDITWLVKVLASSKIQQLVAQYRSVQEVVSWLEEQIPNYQGVPKLMVLSRKSIRMTMGGELFKERMDYLPLPPRLQQFVCMPEMNELCPL